MQNTMTRAEAIPGYHSGKPVIGADEVRRLLQQAVRVYGADHTGQPEFALWEYTDGSDGEKVRIIEVGCIVGAVYQFLGVPLDELHQMPFPKGAYALLTASMNRSKNCPAYFSPAAEELLRLAMKMNDAEVTWGAIADTLAA